MTIGRPETHPSWRVPLPPFAVEMLATYMVNLADDPDAFVFLCSGVVLSCAAPGVFGMGLGRRPDPTWPRYPLTRFEA